MSLIRPIAIGVVLAALASPALAGPNAGAYGYFLTKQPVPIDQTSSNTNFKSAGSPLGNPGVLSSPGLLGNTQGASAAGRSGAVRRSR